MPPRRKANAAAADTAAAKKTVGRVPPTTSKKRAAPAAVKPAQPAAKQRKVTVAVKRRPHVQPEYDEVWKDVYLAGTEWDQVKMVYDIDWDFDHLDEALTDGDLAGKKVHLFGCTEPQLVKRDEKDEKGDVIPIPVIIAIVSEAAPPSMIGLKSVQRTEEEIVPMSKFRMGWHAYTPDNVSHRRRFKPNVFVLKCNERRARLRNMQEAAVHAYDYVLPYFVNPSNVEEVDEDTIVQVLADLDGRPVPLMLEFDYELDELPEFLEEQIKENDLDPAKHTEPLKRSITDAVKATKRKYRAEKEARKKRLDEISPEDKEAIKKMKLLKFYPQNDWPDISQIKSKFVNRYYGHATELL